MLDRSTHRDGGGDNLSPVDRRALKRCVEVASRDPMRREQFVAMADDGRTWLEVALSACFAWQTETLRLKPWESPPCTPRDDAAEAFADELAEAGLSAFEPDPMAALAKLGRASAAAPTACVCAAVWATGRGGGHRGAAKAWAGFLCGHNADTTGVVVRLQLADTR